MSNNELKVPITIQGLDFDTVLRLKKACKYYHVTTGAIFTRLMKKLWVDYGEEIDLGLSQKVHTKLTEKIMRLFYDYKRNDEE